MTLRERLDEGPKTDEGKKMNVISLTEKLREKELMVAGEEPSSAIENEAIDWPPSPPSMAILDMPSTGSRGSAVVDGGGGGATLPLDSGGDSYFQESLIKGGCMGLVEGGAVSEEDGGTSDDGCSYLPGDMFEDASQADNWWVWS